MQPKWVSSSLKYEWNVYVGGWSLLFGFGIRERESEKPLPAENNTLNTLYGAHYLNWPELVSLAFYAVDAVRESQCLGPLLPTVINKESIKMSIHTRCSGPAASRSKGTGGREIGIRHRCIIVIHAKRVRIEFIRGYIEHPGLVSWKWARQWWPVQIWIVLCKR